MALTERAFGYPKPTETGDYQKQNALLEAFINDCNMSYKIDFDNDLIRAGSIFHMGGILLEAETNEAIGGTPSDIIKINISDLTVEYISSFTGISWNSTYNGYYDSDGNLYIIKESLEKRNGNIADIKTKKEKSFVNAYMKIYNTPMMDMGYYTFGLIGEHGVMMDSQIVAVFEGNYLQAYLIDFINKNITLLGSALPVIGGNGNLVKLENNLVAYATTVFSSTWEIRAYEFDGSNFSQKGNTLSLPGMALEYSDFTGLADNTCVLVTESIIQKYEFDGTDFSPLGNELSVSFSRPLVCSYEDDLIFIAERTSYSITAYRFNGSDWEQEGTPIDLYLFPTTGSFKTVGNKIYFSYYDTLSIFEYDGENFTTLLQQGFIGNDDIIGIININDIGIIFKRNGLLYYFGEVEL